MSGRSGFYSYLRGESIGKENYLHAVNVWNMFKMKTVRDYHDYYLKTDVLLIANVFQKFTGVCLECYRSDLCHYFNGPGLSWDTMPKMTGVELELISDNDMYLFVEKGTRENISYIAKRYSEANNKYMKSYDDSNPSNYYVPGRKYSIWLGNESISS